MTSDKRVTQSCPTFCDLVDYAVYGILLAKILESVAVLFSRWSFLPRDWTQVSHIAGGIFTTREPKNTRVGSLSLLQQIFLTQESNWGLLHSRQILYQLSYQGSPKSIYCFEKADWLPKKIIRSIFNSSINRCPKRQVIFSSCLECTSSRNPHGHSFTHSLIQWNPLIHFLPSLFKWHIIVYIIPDLTAKYQPPVSLLTPMILWPFMCLPL